MLSAFLIFFLILLFYICVAFVLNRLEYSKIRLAEKYYKAGRVEEALKVFEEELEKHPENLDCIMNLAKINQELGIHDRAIFFLELASEIGDTRNDVDQVLLHARLTKLYIKTNQIEKAFLSLLTLKQNDVDSWEVYFYLGNIYAAQEMYEDAIECYNKAVSINSDDFFSSFYSSLCAVKLGAVSRACDFLSGPFGDKESNEIPEARLYCGYLYRFKNDEKTIPVLEEFMAGLASEKMKCRAARLLGITYLNDNNIPMAQDAFRRGLDLFPRDNRLFDELVVNYAWTLALLNQDIEQVQKYKNLDDVIAANFSSEEYREILNFLRQPVDPKASHEDLIAKIEKLWHNAVQSIDCPVDIHDYIIRAEKANLKLLQEEFDKEIEVEKKSTVKTSGLFMKFIQILKAPEHFLRLFFSKKKSKRLNMEGELFELLTELTSVSVEKSRASMNRLIELSTSDAAVVLVDGIFGAPREIKDEITTYFLSRFNTTIFEGILKYLKLYNKDNFTIKDHLDPITRAYVAYYKKSWEALSYKDFKILSSIFYRLFEYGDCHYISEFKKMVPRIINTRVLNDKNLRNKGDLFLEMIAKIRPDSIIGSLIKAPGADNDYWTVKISRAIADFDRKRVKKEFEKIYFLKKRNILATAKSIFGLAYGSEMVAAMLSEIRMNYGVVFVTPHNFLGKTGSFYIKQAGFDITLLNQGAKAVHEASSPKTRLVVYDSETTDMSLNSFLSAVQEKKRESKIYYIAVVPASETSRYKENLLSGELAAIVSKPVDFDLMMSEIIGIFE